MPAWPSRGSSAGRPTACRAAAGSYCGLTPQPFATSGWLGCSMLPSRPLCTRPPTPPHLLLQAHAADHAGQHQGPPDRHLACGFGERQGPARLGSVLCMDAGFAATHVWCSRMGSCGGQDVTVQQPHQCRNSCTGGASGQPKTVAAAAPSSAPSCTVWPCGAGRRSSERASLQRAACSWARAASASCSRSLSCRASASLACDSAAEWAVRLRGDHARCGSLQCSELHPSGWHTDHPDWARTLTLKPTCASSSLEACAWPAASSWLAKSRSWSCTGVQRQGRHSRRYGAVQAASQPHDISAATSACLLPTTQFAKLLAWDR